MGDLNSRSAQQSGATDHAVGAVAITGSAQTFNPTCRAIMCGGAGNLQCVMVDGSAVTFVGLAAGQVYPFAIRSIVAAGTTITNSFALL